MSTEGLCKNKKQYLHKLTYHGLLQRNAELNKNLTGKNRDVSPSLFYTSVSKKLKSPMNTIEQFSKVLSNKLDF